MTIATDALRQGLTSKHWSLRSQLDRLPRAATSRWPNGVFDIETFRRAGVSLAIFAPIQLDRQTPHEQDDIYIVVAGRGELQLDLEVLRAEQGDALFIAAGTEHRFQNFSSDFATWVFFFDGPTADSALSDATQRSPI